MSPASSLPSPYLSSFFSICSCVDAQASHMGPNTFVLIRRDQIVIDGFRALNGLGEGLKERIRVQFVNRFGEEEAGVDGGGLFKDFIGEMVKEAFNPNYGFFKVSCLSLSFSLSISVPPSPSHSWLSALAGCRTAGKAPRTGHVFPAASPEVPPPFLAAPFAQATADHHLYPNPAAGLVHQHPAAMFEFLGRILGKSIYEGILLELPLAGFFLKKFQSMRTNDINDLPSLDPELHKQLMFLRSYEVPSQLCPPLSLLPPPSPPQHACEGGPFWAFCLIWYGLV